ncbi:MAG: Hsp33 family molecular chaperone HslO [Oscillospiraceae bacterium]|nr:Hsp33 family molecular chaperone HslO [Oscillospiraceae bacterium]
MENKGTVTTFLTEDGFARLIFAETTGVVQYAGGRHTLSKTVTAALGRGLTAAVLMGSTLKDEGSSLTLRFRGGGPAGGMTCVCDGTGSVRGCVDEPTAELPPNALGKLDVGGVIGREGELYVVRDDGFGEPYVGHVQLVSGEIAEDITNYYAVSEQTPTVCALGVRVNRDGSLKSAGGFLLQLLPGAPDSLAEKLEGRVSVLPSLSALIAEGKGAEDIAALVFGDISWAAVGSTETRYRCSCSRAKYRGSIKSIGIRELADIAGAREGAEVVCRFCGETYFFPPEEVDAMYAERKAELRASAEKRRAGETTPPSEETP